MQETYEGGCHCGRVRFRIRADLGELGECNCSICTKKGILHLPVRREDFVLLSGADALTTYRLTTGGPSTFSARFAASILTGYRAYARTGSPSMPVASTTLSAPC